MRTFRLPWLSFALFAAPLVHAQPPGCGIPRELFETGESNLFTPEQENYLGEAIADHIERYLDVIEDEALTAPLREIGERLARQMPGSDVGFQFFLVDLPFVQAYAAPGGRVYVTRKLVGFARQVDELAGVIGHEMGHVASRHTSAAYSEAFRALGVTELSDREDVFRRYRELIAAGRGLLERDAGSDHGNQVAADRIGVLAVVAAGFDPGAPIAFWDRLVETEGKKGNWFTDVLRFTSPESKRLREMVSIGRGLPPSCRGSRPADLDQEFQAWKENLVLYARKPGQETLRGMVSRASLSPALRSDLEHLRFSPDGKLLAAQDDSGLFLFRRDGLSLSFRVEAPDSEPARFSPDSQSLRFHTRDLKIHEIELDEDGGLARRRVREIFRRDRCSTSALSPNGRALACQSLDGDIVLYDVSTGDVVLQKKEFFPTTALVNLGNLFLFKRQTGPNMGFSPDDRTFIAAYAGLDFPTFTGTDSLPPRAEVHYLAFDLEARKEIKLEGSVRDRVGRGFVFQSPDRIVGVHLEPKKSAIVTFPEGKVVEELPLGFQALDVPARGNFLFLRPVNKAAVGVMDLSAKKIVLASPKPAFDLHENFLANQLANGELELADHRRRESVATAELPMSPLADLVAASVSPDLRWIAISGRSRGGVWNAETGERAFETRAFHSAWFDETGRLYADFPREQETERMIGILETSSGRQFAGVSLGESQEFQHGGLLLGWKDNQLTARSVRSGASLWRLPLDGGFPRFLITPEKNSLVVFWGASSEHARRIFESNVELDSQRKSRGAGEARLVEAYELSTSRLLSRIVVQGGVGEVSSFVSGESLFIADGAERVLAYSLRDGAPQGTWFGRRPAHSVTLGMLALQSSTYEVTLFAAGAFESAGAYTFSSPVSHVAFSEDGRRLLVLTAGQSIFVLDPTVS